MTPAQRRAYRQVFEMVCEFERRHPARTIRDSRKSLDVILEQMKGDLHWRDGRTSCGTKKTQRMENNGDDL